MTHWNVFCENVDCRFSDVRVRKEADARKVAQEHSRKNGHLVDVFRVEQTLAVSYNSGKPAAGKTQG